MIFAPQLNTDLFILNEVPQNNFSIILGGRGVSEWTTWQVSASLVALQINPQKFHIILVVCKEIYLFAISSIILNIV